MVDWEFVATIFLVIMAAIGAWTVGSWLGDKTNAWRKRREKVTK